MVCFFFDGFSLDNNVDINKLFYCFFMGNFIIWIGGIGLVLDDVFKIYNFYLESGDSGVLSCFSCYSFFVNWGFEGIGGVLCYKFNDVFIVSVVYLVDIGQVSIFFDDVFISGGNIFCSGNGFFNGSYSIGV